MRFSLRHYGTGMVSQDGVAKSKRVRNLISYLFPHFPQALHIAEQVAAPQQLATQDNT